MISSISRVFTGLSMMPAVRTCRVPVLFPTFPTIHSNRLPRLSLSLPHANAAALRANSYGMRAFSSKKPSTYNERDKYTGETMLTSYAKEEDPREQKSAYTKSKRLLESYADPNATNRKGVPPIALALKYKNIPLAKLLLEWGAKVIDCKIDGKTVFDMTDDPEMLKLLRERQKRDTYQISRAKYYQN